MKLARLVTEADIDVASSEVQLRCTRSQDNNVQARPMKHNRLLSLGVGQVMEEWLNAD